MPIEQRGVDTIPDEERTSGPRDLVSILLGSNLALGVVIFGWLPVSFGLGFWPSVSSLVLGTVLGTVLTAPLALVSLRTGTNLSTSSGAHFGVRGRLIGSVIGLLLSLGYTALTLWVGGDAVVGSLSRLLGLPSGGFTYAPSTPCSPPAPPLGAVYGYRLLLRLSRVLAVGMSALLAIGLIAYAPDFTTAAPRGRRVPARRLLADLAAGRGLGRAQRPDRLHHPARRLHPLHLPPPAQLAQGLLVAPVWA